MNTEPGLELGNGTQRGGLWVPASVYRDQTIRILGMPGQGKTVLMANLILQEHFQGQSMQFVLDHKDGSLSKQLGGRSDPVRTHVIAPGVAIAEGRPINLNTFDVLADQPEELVACILDLAERVDTMRTNLATMPKIQKYLSMTLRLIAGLPDVSLMTMIDLLEDPAVRLRYLASPGPLAVDDHRLLKRWQTYGGRSRSKPGEQSATQTTEIESTVNRIDALLGSPVLRAWNTGRTNVPIRKWMDTPGELVIFDLATGINPRDRLTLANLLMSTLISLAYGRPDNARATSAIVAVDEFDQLAPKSFTLGIQKLRSAGFSVWANHQLLDQLDGELASTLSGAPLQVFFRTSPIDKGRLARLYGRDVAADLGTMPPYSGLVYMPCGDDGEELWEEIEFPYYPIPLRPGPIRYDHPETTNVSVSCINEGTPAYDDNDDSIEAPAADRSDPGGHSQAAPHPGSLDDRERGADAQDAERGPVRDQPDAHPAVLRGLSVAGWRPTAFRQARPNGRERGD